MPCRALQSFLLLAAVQFGAAARAAEVGITLQVTGALQSEAVTSHDVDGAHFCSAAENPWIARDAIDSRASPYPFYRVVFGQGAPEDEPAAPGPSIGMALSNYFAQARDHSDPGADSIEMVLEGRHFVGHSGLSDPGYRFAVSYREDRRGGGFVARHLHESGTGTGVIDVSGSWRCAPVAADIPEVRVRAHSLFSGATPVRAEATHLRLSRTDAACLDRVCAVWRVIDQTTGEAFLASVDFRRLKLARPIRRLAERGAVVLLVDAEIRPGDPPRVVPRALAGVEPLASGPTAASQQVAMPGPLVR